MASTDEVGLTSVVLRNTSVVIGFEHGQKVLLDGDASMVLTVAAFCIYKSRIEVEVGWVHNGDVKSAWVEDWRLSAAK